MLSNHKVIEWVLSYLNKEINGSLGACLQKGNTEYEKGVHAGLSRFKSIIDNHVKEIDTGTDTGLPDTGTDNISRGW